MVLLNDPMPTKPKHLFARENSVGGKESMIKEGEGRGLVSGGMVESRPRSPMLLTLWPVESTPIDTGGWGRRSTNELITRVRASLDNDKQSGFALAVRSRTAWPQRPCEQRWSTRATINCF